MTDISVVGLGDMGSALAHTLLDNNYSVTVWNRTLDKAANQATQQAHAVGQSARCAGKFSIANAGKPFPGFRDRP